MTEPNTTRLETQRAAPSDLERDLERMRSIARLLDAQFEVAGVKFGWDAIIGLVPGVGDLVTGLIGIYPVILARKHGLGRATQARMAANLLADWAVGSVPLVGDLFDVAFKAHIRNLKLLEKAAEKRRGAALIER